MNWIDVALIALGVVVLIAVLWFVVAIAGMLWFRRKSRKMDEDFEKRREEMRRGRW